MSGTSHETHINSLAAWHAGERSGFFNERELEILDVMHASRMSLRDREVMERCGYTELAKVQPRLSDLVKKGVLREIGRQKCPLSGKFVRLTSIAPPATMKQDLFL